MDESKYEEWFRTQGGRSGGPLDADTWVKARRDLRHLEAAGLDLETVTPAELRLWLVRKLDAKAFGRGRANNIRTEMLRWFRYRDGATPAIPRWREEDPREKALTAREKFDAMGFMHADARLQVRGRFLVFFALVSGAEPSEAAYVREEDFDEEQGGVHILHPCKGHARGFVPLPRSFWSPRRPGITTWLRWREVAKDDPTAIFTGRPNRWGEPKRMDPSGLSREMQRIALATGVRINWQVTRHTLATDLLEAGYDSRYVMRVLRLRNMTHLPRYAEARAMHREYRKLKGLDPWGGA